MSKDSLTLKDNIISALDDYAEYVLKSGFSGAINQEEAVEFILDRVNRDYVLKPVASSAVQPPNILPLRISKNLAPN